MKEMFYNNSISSILYDFIDNNVIIIPCGAESPFEHINVLNELLADYNSSSNLDIYFDFCLLNGITEFRLLKIRYNSSKGLNVLEKETITEKEMPPEIKLLCNKFYKRNTKKIIKKSLLNDYEKGILTQNIAFA